MTTRTWNGSSDPFGTGADWTPTGAPQPGDTAVIASGAPQISASLDQLTLQVGGTADVPTLDVTAAITLGPSLLLQDAAGGVGFDVSVTSTLTSLGTLDAGVAASVVTIGDASTPATFVNGGLIAVGNGDTVVLDDATVIDTGAIAVTGGGSVQVGTGSAATTLSGAGTISLTGGASFEDAGEASGGTVAFGDGAADTLVLDAPSGFTDAVTGFQQGDVIDLVGVDTTKTPATLSYTSGTLTVSNGGVEVASFALPGSFTATSFAQVAAGGDTLIEIACFLAGTRIATPGGEVPVEALAAGDVVLTASGRLAPVRWVGRRHLDLGAAPRPERARPVRIARDAIAPGVPRRAVWVSPEHTIFLHGRLVPARCLVNGATITQPARRDMITYVHLELDRHDILLAEGLATESWLDTGNRSAFEGVARVPAPLARTAAAAAARAWRDHGCARLLTHGAVLATIRAELAARAATRGFRLGGGADLHVRLPDGRRVDPVARAGAMLDFALPPGTGAMTLGSRSGFPGQALADGRRLGVRLDAIGFAGTSGRRTVALDDPALTDGFHAPETDGKARWRWTDGAAVLEARGAGLMHLRVAEHHEYVARVASSVAGPYCGATIR